MGTLAAFVFAIGLERAPIDVKPPPPPPLPPDDDPFTCVIFDEPEPLPPPCPDHFEGLPRLEMLEPCPDRIDEIVADAERVGP